MTGDGLLLVLLIGGMAGLIVGRLVQGAGFGPVGDLIIGVVGAVIGSWLLPQLRAPLGTDSFAASTNATMGAIVFLLFVRNFSGGDRFGGSRRVRLVAKRCSRSVTRHWSALPGRAAINLMPPWLS